MTPEQILDDLTATYRADVLDEVAELHLGRRAQARRAEALVVPHDPDLEQAVTGAALVSERCLDAALATGWTHDACYVPAHRRITAALLELYGDGEVIDARTCVRVMDHLDDTGRLLDGDCQLVGLMMAASCPLPTGVARDATRLVDLWRRRHADRLGEVA